MNPDEEKAASEATALLAQQIVIDLPKQCVEGTRLLRVLLPYSGYSGAAAGGGFAVGAVGTTW